MITYLDLMIAGQKFECEQELNKHNGPLGGAKGAQAEDFMEEVMDYDPNDHYLDKWETMREQLSSFIAAAKAAKVGQNNVYPANGKHNQAGNLGPNGRNNRNHQQGGNNNNV